ncbi:early nodulin-like protein 21 [Humulus lupulus]|uniref:early nodulin-like protein 21 n=1 Tax=Humulus lupulus TaxID=3486 RepID=UPI002B404D17|nr:early nodulin-like protein 21 [Humulus lupulus]
MAMAFNSIRAVLFFFFCIFFFSLHVVTVVSFEFEVGGTEGWVVPSSNKSNVYNDWASENRFQLGDTIVFKYRKDSVMEVPEEDYKNCNSSHPNFFSNNGHTVFKLNQTQPFYFISGVFRHCQKGQRMIIKVKTPGEAPSDGGGSGGGASSAGSRPGAAVSSVGVFFSLFVLSFAASVVV